MEREDLKEIVFDDLQETDLPEVVAIEQASFTVPWSEILFNNELHNPRSLPRVARFGGKIVGYLCASRILDEGHILTLAVHQDFRRRGIASALVKDMIERLKEEGCRFIYLEVRDSNEEAKRMYAKFGFESIGVRKNYYVSPIEDAVLMVLRLGDDTS